jgi:hypothetical protein
MIFAPSLGLGRELALGVEVPVSPPTQSGASSEEERGDQDQAADDPGLPPEPIPKAAVPTGGGDLGWAYRPVHEINPTLPAEEKSKGGVSLFPPDKPLLLGGL